MTDAEDERERYRLQFLYEPPAGERVSLDVIAVLDVEGSPDRSWSLSTKKHGHCAWLREGLPKHLPGACVMLFTYNSSLHGNWNLLSSNWLQYMASSLVKSIEDRRRAEVSRPIAFIARGLGGAIVKKAFLLPPDRSVLITGSRDQINPLVGDSSCI
jgi:hypothetical protein